MSGFDPDAWPIIEQHPRELRWADGKLQQLWVVIDRTSGHARQEWRDVPSVNSDDSKE